MSKICEKTTALLLWIIFAVIATIMGTVGITYSAKEITEDEVYLDQRGHRQQPTLSI